MASEEDHSDPIYQLVSWVATHVEAEANFEGAESLFVGDLDVLISVSPMDVLQSGSAWSWAHTALGRALMIAGPGPDHDGPWVWVVGTDDGPLASIEISPRLDMSKSGSEEWLGQVVCTSGRVLISPLSAAHWWGERAKTVRLERNADFKIAEDIPGPLREGYAVMVDVPPNTSLDVFENRTATGKSAGFSIKIPGPAWLPKALPLQDGDA